MVVTFWNVIESRMLFFCVHSEDLFYDQRHAACVHHATRMLASNVALLRRCTVDATQSVPSKKNVKPASTQSSINTVVYMLVQEHRG